MKRRIIFSLFCCLFLVGTVQTSNGQKLSKAVGAKSEASVISNAGMRNARYTTVSGKAVRYTTVGTEVRHHSGHRMTQAGQVRNCPQRYSAVSQEPAKYTIGGAGLYTQQEPAVSEEKNQGGNAGKIILYSLLLGGLLVAEVVLLGSM